MQSIKLTARVAGILYLIVIVCGIFAEKYVRIRLVDFNDGAQTIINISQNELLYRLGFVSDLLMQSAYFLLPVLLYRILKKANKWLAQIMVLCVSVAVAIMCINMLNHYAPLLLINSEGFNSVQIQNQVLFYLTLHSHGYHIAQIFFGIWLLPLGYLTFKSGLFPKFIGVFLMIGCLGYLTAFGIYFIFPEKSEVLSSYLTIPADIGEFSLCLYLLIIGVKKVPNNNCERLAADSTEYLHQNN
ncbi:DUF4386 domain-containing protein [Aurantibacter crassamenti]|uniref:DUF4386 domain-containing protein n=1 Tax=Aurantibacter crassamenti TaxID=1837375 RepID=UPI001939F0E4|nr:DUF4386 domain-containing protein [Aurantibacter crassamenti]MBM1106551.1 DUF4386 domain-containing protein [Aurantibacter crassamenti]